MELWCCTCNSRAATTTTPVHALLLVPTNSGISSDGRSFCSAGEQQRRLWLSVQSNESTATTAASTSASVLSAAATAAAATTTRKHRRNSTNVVGCWCTIHSRRISCPAAAGPAAAGDYATEYNGAICCPGICSTTTTT